MARRSQDMRDSKGRYIKLTVARKLKHFCNMFILKLEKWTKGAE